MTPTADTRAAIDAANQKFMAAFGRQDSAGIAGLYTTDGQLFPSNSDIVNGAASIQAFWQGASIAARVSAAGVIVPLLGRYSRAPRVRH